MKILLSVLLQLAITSVMAQLQPVVSGVFHWNELPVEKREFIERRDIVQGTTTEFAFFNIRAITLKKENPPAQDTSKYEEVVIIKEGKLNCSIGDQAGELGPGSVLLIPPMEMKEIGNNNAPVTFYVLTFYSNKPVDIERSTKAGGALLINADTIAYTEKNDKGTEKYFDRPTAMCENYEMHITTLKKKGPSHTSHQHVDTEIILVIEGEVEMTIDGKNYKGGAGDLFIVESGKTHGVSNAADKECRYFAFKWR